jgi:hypothetical protein
LENRCQFIQGNAKVRKLRPLSSAPVRFALIQLATRAKNQNFTRIASCGFRFRAVLARREDLFERASSLWADGTFPVNSPFNKTIKMAQMSENPRPAVPSGESSSLHKDVKIDGKWRYCRAAEYSNHKVKPDIVLVRHDCNLGR